MPTTLLKVRYYAHVGQLTGYGRAATEYAMAMLKHPGFDLDVVPLGEGALDERTKVLMPKIQRGDFTPDVVLVHTLPRDCERVLDAVKIDARATPCAAMTTWEAATFPEQHLSWFTPFRRVLVPSEAAKRAIDSPWLPRHRCAVVPHCYDPTLVEMMRAAMPPAPTDPDRPFVFYYVGAWNRRKNVEGLLQAYAHAHAQGYFDGNRPARLMIQAAGAEPRVVAETMASLGLERDIGIRLNLQPITESQLWELHLHSGDCFVSASRGEAWNLGAFEATLGGRFVIVPEGQGSDEYLRPPRRVIPSRRTPATLDAVALEAIDEQWKMRISGASGLSAAVLWQDPDLCHLAFEMENAYHYRNEHPAPSLSEFAHDAVAGTLHHQLMEIANVQ